MTPQQSNEYISKLMRGDVVLVDPVEQEVWKNFQKAHQSVVEAYERIQKLRGDLEQMQQLVLRVEGKREAFADLLVQAESVRAKASEIKSEGQTDMADALSLLGSLPNAKIVPAFRPQAANP